jgi:hypothetical protein
MNNNTDPTKGFESTYALIVRSEEKDRGFSEGVAYVVFMMSAIFSIWQAAHQPVTVPAEGIVHSSPIVQAATAQSIEV